MWGPHQHSNGREFSNILVAPPPGPGPPEHLFLVLAGLGTLAGLGALLEVCLGVFSGVTGMLQAGFLLAAFASGLLFARHAHARAMQELRVSNGALRCSEARLRSLTLAVAEVVWAVDEQGNDADMGVPECGWQDFTGQARRPEHPLGWLTSVHPDDRAAAAQAWEDAIRQHSIYQAEYRLRRHDGVYVPMVSRAVPMVGEDNQVRGWLGVNIDISAYRTIESEREDLLRRERAMRQRAEAAEGRARFLATAGAELSTSLDYETTLLQIAALTVPGLASHCYLDLVAVGLQVQRLEVIARSETAACAPTLRPSVVQLAATSLQAAVLTTKRRATAVACQPPDQPSGQAPATAVLVVPLVARGQALGALTLMGDRAAGFEDANALRMVEEFAQRAALALDNARLFAETQQAVTARDEFLSIASHELQTPVTAFGLQLESLQHHVNQPAERVSVERVRVKVDTVIRQTSRLVRLVEDLLDVSRMRLGRLVLARRQVDLGELVEEICADLRGTVVAHGGALSYERPTQAVLGSWDRRRVQQVLSNLLSNALKYGAGKPVEVTVHARLDGAVLTVRDHGIGMAPEHFSRIFRRFERVASIRQYGGLGLGLYITQQIVEAHGGTVLASSRLGEGATFTICLPYGAGDDVRGSPGHGPLAHAAAAAGCGSTA